MVRKIVIGLVTLILVSVGFYLFITPTPPMAKDTRLVTEGAAPETSKAFVAQQ
jgi:hypothetical protein